jgi:hypothetical protein
MMGCAKHGATVPSQEDLRYDFNGLFIDGFVVNILILA